MCLHNGEPVDPGQCDAEAMPASDGDCNVEDCPEASGDDEETEDAQPEYSDGSKYHTIYFKPAFLSKKSTYMTF